MNLAWQLVIIIGTTGIMCGAIGGVFMLQDRWHERKFATNDTVVFAQTIDTRFKIIANRVKDLEKALKNSNIDLAEDFSKTHEFDTRTRVFKR